ncbi:MAG: ABC transporter substrate-binding protein [Gammaproteobacteria bacterium]|nr:ABC transporter substrate-binding protein [Gammaproteobacteria bacterium]
MKWRLHLASVIIAITLASGQSAAQDMLDANIIYLARDEQPHQPLSLLEAVVEDNGLPGARLALKDTQTTGSFLGQTYSLQHVVIGEGDDLIATYRELLSAGNRLFIVDLNATDILDLAAVDKDVLLLNIRASDNSLRNQSCQPMLFHFPPSRAMLADALAQYLAWKRWNRLVLVTGRHPEDTAFAESFKRAAKRFGLKFVEEKPWTAIPGARRTDSGHHNLQQEIPAFTQFDEHDVLLVADEADEFGEYLSYRSKQPRLVAGSHGLIPTAWHRSQEQWGATQLQRRFSRMAGRWMTARDYSAWLALRTLGEAFVNTASKSPARIREYLLSGKFKLAGFKGVPLTFRDWNGQLRQPILVTGPRMLVTVSPQKGFLHQRSQLDTLGFDKPESSCKNF